jgi:serine/threonine-protein kinase
VHRDLKPANVMLTKAGAMLLDFGLATLRKPGGPIAMMDMLDVATETGTAEGTILGTLHYMAPEQVEGKEADARSDIWALGAVIYEMVTGSRPFTGDSPASVIGAILRDQPADLATRTPASPPLLGRIVATCLAKDPDARWQSAADVREALRWVAEPVAGSAGSAPGPGHSPKRAVALLAAGSVAGVGRWRWPEVGGRPRPPQYLPRSCASN